MDLRQQIRNLIESGPHIYDKKYQACDGHILRQQFFKIRSYLVKNFSAQDIVVIGIDNDYLYPITVLACMEIGLTYIPIKADWPKQRIEQIYQLSQFKKLIDKDIMEQVLSESEVEESFEVLPSFQVTPDSRLYIMFTSGSTGEPKGVQIPRKAYENFLLWIDQTFTEINNQDRLINSTQYTFDVYLTELGLLLTKKLNFYCSNLDNNVLVLAKELSDLKITVSVTVPNNYNIFLSERLLPEIDLSNLKSILLAGSRFPLALYKRFKEVLPDVSLYNCYGPTEATVYCLYKKLDGDNDIAEDNISIGKALPQLEARVIDEDGNELNSGERGELIVGGIQVMDGYLNRPELTEKVIIEKDNIRFYKTGDLVFKTQEGHYFVVGRIDDTIKVSGQRVNLSDIDGYILDLDEVNEAATVAKPCPLKEYELYTFVVLNINASVEDIKNKLKQTLLPFQLPKKIIPISTMPTNNSGKICKKTLKTMI